MPPISRIHARPNISEELANRVRDMIARAELEPGGRINEVHLAADLGVSRTPLREALTALAAEGALFTIPRRGFFVQKLSLAEFGCIYPIRQILDPEALLLAGIPDQRRLERLEALNKKLERAVKVTDRIELDDRWHMLLLEGCPNTVLLDLIRQFIRRTRRYEFAYLGDGNNLRAAVDEHRAIMSALERDDLKVARRALKKNLTSGMQPILDWLKTRGL